MRSAKAIWKAWTMMVACLPFIAGCVIPKNNGGYRAAAPAQPITIGFYARIGDLTANGTCYATMNQPEQGYQMVEIYTAGCSPPDNARNGVLTWFLATHTGFVDFYDGSTFAMRCTATGYQMYNMSGTIFGD
jgi:hypothetical protein